MKKAISLVLIGFILSGCSPFKTHKMDIEQGNVISQEDASKLRVGMSEAQVQEFMGTPVLINTFSNDRVDYIYTFQAGYGTMNEKRIVCSFQRGILRDIQRN